MPTIALRVCGSGFRTNWVRNPNQPRGSCYGAAVTPATTPTPPAVPADATHGDAAHTGAQHPGTPEAQRACSIARSLDVMGDRWSILILRDTFRGIRRFEEIRRDLEIPRAVLSDRLSALVEAGVLEKRMYMEHPPRHEYRLTDMGRELSPVLVGLMQWGDRWLGDGRAPTVLVLLSVLACCAINNTNNIHRVIRRGTPTAQLCMLVVVGTMCVHTCGTATRVHTQGARIICR